jgi:hypothetical protein
MKTGTIVRSKRQITFAELVWKKEMEGPTETLYRQYQIPQSSQGGYMKACFFVNCVNTMRDIFAFVVFL